MRKGTMNMRKFRQNRTKEIRGNTMVIGVQRRSFCQNRIENRKGRKSKEKDGIDQDGSIQFVIGWMSS
jgi:hypothetical protein